jgi:hypothetical protein
VGLPLELSSSTNIVNNLLDVKFVSIKPPLQHDEGDVGTDTPEIIVTDELTNIRKAIDDPV